MTESWANIKEYPKYSVSDLGRVRNNLTGKVLKAQEYRGYLRVSLCPSKIPNLKCDRVSVSRLVATYFVDNRGGFPIVNHIDGNKKNNLPGNLEWCSNSHNQKHAFRLKLNKPSRGDESPASKISSKGIVQIRSMWESSTYTQAEIAKKFKVSRSHVSNILRGAKRVYA